MAITHSRLIAMETTTKEILLAAIGASGALFAAIVMFFLTRKKNVAETHKTESDSDKARFETLKLYQEVLEQLRLAHERAIADDVTIAKLERDIAECRAGHKDWSDCRDEAVAFLHEVEGHVKDDVLRVKVGVTRGRLEALSI